MAIVKLITIKSWFKTHYHPTQAQFYDTWDSFWHKEELIPITQIEDIENILIAKADAEVLAYQVNVLQNQIDGITIILGSDNIDLNNVQELVDAIEMVQLSLNTILVNDLTTGGTTKALTAEMGKTLRELILAIPTANLELIDYPSLTQDLVQTFEIPEGKIARQVFINKSQQLFLETENNISDTDTFSQLGTTITINQPTEIGNYIGIFIQ
jgi:hypothetical protein